jgi:hypothetical protein
VCAFIAAEREKWKPIVEKAGIVLNKAGSKFSADDED